jgi:mannan endo-1,4-beta-mannosidase
VSVLSSADRPWRALWRLMAVAVTVLLAATALVAVSDGAARAAASDFVRPDGSSFSLNGQPFRYGGTNNYYLHYASPTMVDDVLDDAASMNLKVVRSWTFLECGSADGSVPNSEGGCSQGADHWMQRWDPQAGKPVYNTGAGGLQKLDYLLAQAEARGEKIIMVLTNNWKDFGGMDQYVTWHGLRYHDQFYTDPGIRADYKAWAAQLINRTNSITGVKYRDDPTIFSWELANEPRCIYGTLPDSGTCTPQTLVDWADEMSGYVKSLDPNHMVSIGDEGFLNWGRSSDWPYNAVDGVDHEALTSLPDIDFGTFHLYPNGWGETISWGTQWIKDHLTAASGYGKPVIAEEFGDQNPSTRDATYQTWTDTMRTGGGAGWNFWILTGVQDDGSQYPDFDGFRVNYPSTTATLLASAATAIGGSSPPPTDTSPPSAPTGLRVTGTTASSVSLSWTASTDNTGVTGYQIFRGGTQVGTSTTTSFTSSGLTASTAYSFTVRARDAAGNTSAASTAVTGTTTAAGGGGGGSCTAAYHVDNDWGAGFTATVTITNNSTSATSSWQAAWTWPGSQQITNSWNAAVTQSGTSATAKNAAYNGSLAAGASTSFGFQGSYGGTNTAPSLSCTSS